MTTKSKKAKTRRYRVSEDAALHPTLQEQLGVLRGGMVDAAEEFHLPPRFTARPHADRPAFIVTDTQTGRATEVGLYAYGDLRQALADLFPEDGR